MVLIIELLVHMLGKHGIHVYVDHPPLNVMVDSYPTHFISSNKFHFPFAFVSMNALQKL